MLTIKQPDGTTLIVPFDTLQEYEEHKKKGEREGLVCACGNHKDRKYKTCWRCSNAKPELIN